MTPTGRETIRKGFAQAAISGLDCASLDELRQPEQDLVQAWGVVQDLIEKGTIEECPDHPGRYRATKKGVEETMPVFRRAMLRRT